MPRPLRPLALAVAVALFAPAGALAQEPGVTFDDGPSSKEYAIPLDAARAQTRTKAPARASDSSAAATASDQPADAAPATGQGSRDGSSSSSSSDRSSKRSDDRSRDANAGAEAASPTRTPASALDTRAAATSDGLGAGVVIAGLAAAALALGALGGLVLRRRRTPGDAF
jgi:cobalamin biosynthesis Mg chelatase CobN